MNMQLVSAVKRLHYSRLLLDESNDVHRALHPGHRESLEEKKTLR